MNKYQKALNKIVDVIEGDFSIAGIFFEHNEKTYDALDILKELVENTTPKKVIVEGFVNCFDCFDTCISYEEEIKKCPNCQQSLYDESEEIDLVGWNCCPNCGQALDWSEEE